MIYYDSHDSYSINYIFVNSLCGKLVIKELVLSLCQ